MDLKIASRKSDLARIQALLVAQHLVAAHPQLEIHHHFRESLGDKNLDDPLWKMPSQGVFTEDFLEDLVAGRQDMIVHSWKDLPTEERPETEVYATLPREDVRDLMLFKKSSLEKIRKSQTLRCFSSSPRRVYNLSRFLVKALPVTVEKVEFESVRGNVPTRIKKLLEGDVDALIVAKAAMDRLLTAPGKEFEEIKKQLREDLSELLWMVLPLSENPAAPAQGALAIEIRRDRNDLKELLDSVNCLETKKQVESERREFKEYGGGCHQKIGLTYLNRDYGELNSLRGETEEGETLCRWEFVREKKLNWEKATESEIFPLDLEQLHFFSRQTLSVDCHQLQGRDLWVARANALPDSYQPREEQAVWCSGLKSWEKLAQRGIWVNGCAESLGEKEDPRVEILLGRAPNWLKLTHTEGAGEKTLATYQLAESSQLKEMSSQLSKIRYFYWQSSSQFLAVLKHCPEIREAYHACGPGHSYERILAHLPGVHKIGIFLSHDAWKNEVLNGK